MRQIFLVLAVVALTMTSCRHESLEDRATKDAAEMTRKQCPTPYRNDVRVDSVVFNNMTKSFVYYCSIRNRLDDKSLIDKHRSEIVDEYRKQVAGTPSIKVYRQAKFRFEYVFRSAKTGKVILDFVV